MWMNCRVILLPILLLLMSFSLSSCGSSSEDSAASFEPRVFGGAELDPTFFPQFLRLDFTEPDGSSSICSAVAASDSTVLTAAHCFTEPFESVALSRQLPDGNFERIELESFELHPGYRFAEGDFAAFNDVAVLRLPEGVTVPALPLLKDFEILPGDRFSVFGFGLDENGGFGFLRSGAVPIEFLTENHVIAAPFDGTTANPCFGDSGGALVLQRFNEELQLDEAFLVGLVSTGTAQRCEEGDLNLYTRLDSDSIRSFLYPSATFALR